MAAVKGAVAPDIDPKSRPEGYSIDFNLDDADLPELVKAISSITGKHFIFGGKLRQIKATVHSPSRISVGEAYQAFLSILQANGMTVVQHGRFLKIVETTGVVGESLEVYPQAAPVPDEDRFLTRLYRLVHLDASEAAGVLAKFKSKEGDITVHAPGNLLILTETGSNVRRMLKILDEIDTGGAGEQIWVETLNYAGAADLANKLTDILDLKGRTPATGSAGATPAPKGGSGTRVVADERNNALVIVATEPDYLRIFELIKRFDVKPSGDGEIRVRMLQHSVCKDLSQTLNQLLGASASTTGARPPGATGATASAVRTPGAAGSGLEEVFEGKVRVTCDESTNALLTTSSLRDYAQLRTVIDKLDQPRRQVFIEATIMDVSVDRSTQLGVSYHAGTSVGFGSAGTGTVYGGSDIATSVTGVPSNLEGLALGVVGPAIPNSQNILGTGLSIPALGAVLSAMAKDGDANVLATPHILATDNIKAEISIGQNIPLQQNVSSLASLGALAGATGSSALGALSGVGSTAQRQDVGTKISVTPHVNDSDQVRLELAEEISEAGAAQGSLGAVPINKRTANTTLIVRDRQTVVIGGLMRETGTTSETKIPLLGDIPVLGFLFKQTSKTKQKANLLLVLTPYIIRDQEDLRVIFERKMQERQEIIDRYFVFGDSPWKPPQDYRRSNGLVEDIRQSMLAQEEKRRFDDESKPAPKRPHEPGLPITRPLGSGHASREAEPGAPKTGTPATPVAPGPARMERGSARPSRRAVDRVE
jgi:general secretion pathway protein D